MALTQEQQDHIKAAGAEVFTILGDPKFWQLMQVLMMASGHATAAAAVPTVSSAVMIAGELIQTAGKPG